MSGTREDSGKRAAAATGGRAIGSERFVQDRDQDRNRIFRLSAEAREQGDRVHSHLAVGVMNCLDQRRDRGGRDGRSLEFVQGLGRHRERSDHRRPA